MSISHKSQTCFPWAHYENLQMHLLNEFWASLNYHIEEEGPENLENVKCSVFSKAGRWMKQTID